MGQAASLPKTGAMISPVSQRREVERQNKTYFLTRNSGREGRRKDRERERERKRKRESG
jgi:hypothetical protein